MVYTSTQLRQPKPPLVCTYSVTEALKSSSEEGMLLSFYFNTEGYINLPLRSSKSSMGTCRSPSRSVTDMSKMNKQVNSLWKPGPAQAWRNSTTLKKKKKKILYHINQFT